MKRILIMRHAKSDWEDGSLRDFDRPLNHRGINDAPLIGRELKKRGLTPDLFISSPAKRAKMTAGAVAENSGYENEIIWNKDYYFGYTVEIIQSLKELDEQTNSVIIFGHNPTWSAIAEFLTGGFYSMSTAELIGLEYSGKWKDLSEKKCKQTFKISPKNLN